MPHWAIALLSAAAASVLTTLFREVVACLRQPKLKLDFEECDGRKPYVLDQFWGLRIAGKTSKVNFFVLTYVMMGESLHLIVKRKWLF